MEIGLIAGMAVGLAALAFLSGMLGLGVAFAAVPFLGLFLPDLVHQVQPLSLLLNGLTALFSAVGFAQSKHIAWRRAWTLAGITTVSAPLGSELAMVLPAEWIWVVYFVAVAFLAFRLFRPTQERPGAERFTLAAVLAVPISMLGGLLGVGPGFLLLPTLIVLGFEAKKAAGINAIAVTPPSFSALVPHIGTAEIDLTLAVTLVIVGSLAAFAGARVTSLFVPDQRLKQGFGVLLVLMTAYRLVTLL